MGFRRITPSRTAGVSVQKDYKKYREQLRKDFNCRCGYCDDIDIPRAERFEIDHFVPRKIDITRELDYSNPVYACRSCNNAKRAKWPTEDKQLPNDGKTGWIDPCDADYDSQFDRGAYGEIVAVTDIGKWMFDALNLWKPQHEILWCYEEIDKQIDEVSAHLDNIHDEVTLKQIIAMHKLKERILNKLYL